MIEKPLKRYTQLDSGALCQLYRSEDVYAPSADDYSKPGELQRFIDAMLGSPHLYALGRDARWEAFIFSPSHNATTWMAHFAVRKDKRDGAVVRRVAEAGKWVFEKTQCQSIITFIREDNHPARSIIAQLGMTRKGKLDGSVSFNGEMKDEIIYQCNIDDFNKIWGDSLGVVNKCLG